MFQTWQNARAACLEEILLRRLGLKFKLNILASKYPLLENKFQHKCQYQSKTEILKLNGNKMHLMYIFIKFTLKYFLFKIVSP